MIHTVLTHEFPDLDAILSIWLLRRFGSIMFPGVEKSKMLFVPAANQFDQSAADNEGVIAVDIRGGHFDHHDEKDATKCSAQLVAEHLKVAKDPALDKILRVVNKQDLTGQGFGSKIDPAFSLFTLYEMVRGWHVLNNGDHELTVIQASECLDAMSACEQDWNQALVDCNSAIVHQGIAMKIVAVRSPSKTAMKAGRQSGANIVVVDNLNGNVGITATRNEKWSNPDLTELAAILRLASCMVKDVLPSLEELFSEGLIYGWFLHQSKVILAHGSDRSAATEPCPLELEEIAALTALICNLPTQLPKRIESVRSRWQETKKLRRQ